MDPVIVEGRGVMEEEDTVIVEVRWSRDEVEPVVVEVRGAGRRWTQSFWR